MGLLRFIVFSTAISLAYLSSIYSAYSEDLTFTFAEWRPAIYLDEDGAPQGFYADLINEALVKRLGLNMAYRQVPWKRAQAEVKQGLSDLLITVPTPERLDYAYPSTTPVYDIRMVIYTQKDHPQLADIKNITSVNDIKKLQLTAVTNLGNGWHKFNVEEKGVNTIIAPADKNSAHVLAGKRADIMIDAQDSMDVLLQKEKLNDKIINTQVTFGVINMHLLMSKKSAYIDQLPSINVVIDTMKKDGSLQRIRDKSRGDN